MRDRRGGRADGRRRAPAVVVALLAASLAGGSAGAQGPGPGRPMPNLGQQHVPNGTLVTYPSYPPTSGPHWPKWADWGVHAEPVPAPEFVHNLEHGGVVILYRCAGPCPGVVRQLEETFRALPPSKYGHVKVVVSPDDRIATPFALLAWTRLDELDRFDRERIVRFVRAYQDQGPEDVP